MIRTGSSSTGVSSLLNSFHSTRPNSSGFFTNTVGSNPPPPAFPRWVGTDDLEEVPPFALEQGDTFFLSLDDLRVNQSVSTFYINLEADSTVPSGYVPKWNVTFGDAYSGTVRTVLEGSKSYLSSREFSGAVSFYLRFTTRRQDISIFSGGGHLYILGPLCQALVVETFPNEFDLKGINKKYPGSNMSFTGYPGRMVLGTVDTKYDVIPLNQLYTKNPVSTTLRMDSIGIYFFP